ncbi:hypothetical protein C0J52_09942 [Blattella germanica]|nr:hypothetical protein C0J52_09942 [Blattella germanica]
MNTSVGPKANGDAGDAGAAPRVLYRRAGRRAGDSGEAPPLREEWCPPDFADLGDRGAPGVRAASGAGALGRQRDRLRQGALGRARPALGRRPLPRPLPGHPFFRRRGQDLQRLRDDGAHGQDHGGRCLGQGHRGHGHPLHPDRQGPAAPAGTDGSKTKGGARRQRRVMGLHPFCT